MKLFLLSQNVQRGMDTYDSFVVAAKSEQEARLIHPSGRSLADTTYWAGDWVPLKHIDKISVEYLGRTKREAGVICSSFTGY